MMLEYLSPSALLPSLVIFTSSSTMGYLILHSLDLEVDKFAISLELFLVVSYYNF
jgi:hypothetical protein